jgi:hypothetical protein
MVNGIFPIFMATIPRRRSTRTTMRRCSASRWALRDPRRRVRPDRWPGFLNDKIGPDTWLYLLMGLAVISGFISMGLRETAPLVLARKGLQPAAA